MQTRIRRWALLSTLAAGACLWAASPARADDAGKISVGGLADWYYQYSFNHPPVGSTIAGRSFDVKNDAFSLSLAEVNVVKPVDDRSPLGFTATLTFGKTADLVHATEPGGTNTYKYLQQLYGTYLVNGKRPLTIDFGKFVTLMGYEVIESSSNDNYSRSFLFNYAIPFYHAGLRFTYPLTSTLTGQLHLVNGWNDVEDDNGGKSVGAQLAWNPSAAWSWVLNYMGGDEFTGAGLPRNLNLQTVDLVGIWRPTPKLKLGINADYASAAKKGVAGGNWSGQAVYARYQITPNAAFALRAEHFEDSAGLRTGTAQNLNEITATFEYVVKNNLIHRLEFRHDHAGSKFFPGGGGPSNDQDTLTFSQVIKF
jgi:hypothetical protein